MTRMARGCGDEFQTKWFETKINLRIHQAAGMHRQEFHVLKQTIRFL
jgi:hypothetical protein